MKHILSAELMKKSDNLTCESVGAVTLMARAGRAIFEAVPWKSPVAIVCGVGNNAGDGFALAGLLAEAGVDCTVFRLSEKVSETSRPFFEKCVELGVKMRDELNLDGFKAVVDCIFGIGFRGELGEPYITAIGKINDSDLYKIAVDISSGLNADSGLPCPAAVKADLTLAIGQYKSGHFLGSAKDYRGELRCLDIGIEPCERPSELVEASDIAKFFVREKSNVHKGDFGYIALIGGSREYSGAAKLANLALSSLRSGAGVAKLAVPRSISNGVLPYLLESTLFELDDCQGRYKFDAETTERLLRGTRVIALGMGMGKSGEVAKLLEHLLESYSGRLIIDADGLNTLAEMDRELLKNAKPRVILTPHPKEFERLSGIPIAEFTKNPVAFAEAYARETNTILLLKGAATIVTDGNQTFITDRGSAGMSTAGSGDILSGILAGVCAPTAVSDSDLTLAVAAGAYLNGLAGELAAEEIGSVAMLSGDTAAHIPAAIREITKAKAKAKAVD